MQDLRMDTFIAVCEHMNFTRASEVLNLTQPAVSRQMKSLEEYYGVELFRYEGKKMYLTPAGAKLFKVAQSMKADEIRLMEELKSSETREICFGSTPTPAEFMIPKKISKYLSENDFSKISMVVGNTEVLLNKLDKGEIDFAVVEGNFSKKDYRYFKFSTQKYFPVCSTNIDIKNCSIENLINETLIVREEGSGNREILKQCLKRKNIRIDDFKKILEVNNISVQKALVKEGLGIAFLFEAVVTDEISKGILKRIELDGFPLEHEINFVCRKNSIFNDEIEKAKVFFDMD